MPYIIGTCCKKPHHLLHCNETKAMWKTISFDRILKQWSSCQTIGWENNKCLAGEMEQWHWLCIHEVPGQFIVTKELSCNHNLYSINTLHSSCDIVQMKNKIEFDRRTIKCSYINIIVLHFIHFKYDQAKCLYLIFGLSQSIRTSLIKGFGQNQTSQTGSTTTYTIIWLAVNIVTNELVARWLRAKIHNYAGIIFTTVQRIVILELCWNLTNKYKTSFCFDNRNRSINFNRTVRLHYSNIVMHIILQ